ncbi:RNA-guided endonuclease TnpB family protein, partial [Streptomyces sp. NPDC005070]
MKIGTQVKLLPDAAQASALERTLRTVNDAANWASEVAFEHDVPREYELRKHTYAELKARGLGAQAAQHTIKKVRDAYTTLKANIRAGNLGRDGSRRRRKAESKPVTFRPEAAQPYDDRCLSWQYDQRTVSIWTVDGRVRNVPFVCSADALQMLQAHRHGESDLVERDGVFYLVATCDVPEAEQYEPDGFIGVDLG